VSEGDWRLVLYRGIWCAYRRDKGRPVRRSSGTADREAARRWFEDWKRLSLAPAQPTIGDLWAAYVEAKAGRHVVVNMTSEWKRMEPEIGHLYPHQLTAGHVRGYIEKRRAAGIGDGMLWTELGHLRTVLAWAVKVQLLDRAPHVERPSKPPPRDRWLTREEAGALITACATPHIRLFVILMLTTAARPTAALELTWDRVDLERGWVVLASGTTQNRKGRATVPMNRTLRAALSTAWEGRTTDYVIEFAGERVQSVKTAFNAACERAKLAGVTPHTLRHTAAVWMAADGHPMAKIAQYLGHKDSRITEAVYARYAPEHMKDAASSLELSISERQWRKVARRSGDQ
jgi:integrase